MYHSIVYKSNLQYTARFARLPFLNLGQILINIITDDTNTGIECTLNSFEDGTKLNGAAVMLEGGDAMQRDLDRLEESGS